MRPLLPTHRAVPGNSQSGVVDRDASEITNVVLTNLGGTGTYQDVMSMADGEINCPDEEAACVKEVSFGVILAHCLFISNFWLGFCGFNMMIATRKGNVVAT